MLAAANNTGICLADWLAHISNRHESRTQVADRTKAIVADTFRLEPLRAEVRHSDAG